MTILLYTHSPVFTTSSHSTPCEAQLTTGSREDDKDLDDHLCIVLHSLPLLVDHHLEEDAKIFTWGLPRHASQPTFSERLTNLNFSSHHVELHVCTCICMSMCCKTQQWNSSMRTPLKSGHLYKKDTLYCLKCHVCVLYKP